MANIDKAQALIKSGLMHPAGLAAFAARSAENSKGYSYESRPAAARSVPVNGGTVPYGNDNDDQDFFFQPAD